jgi:hypothetical protein
MNESMTEKERVLERLKNERLKNGDRCSHAGNAPPVAVHQPHPICRALPFFFRAVARKNPTFDEWCARRDSNPVSSLYNAATTFMRFNSARPFTGSLSSDATNGPNRR